MEAIAVAKSRAFSLSGCTPKSTTPPERNMIARRRRYFHGRALKSRQGYVCTDSAKVHVPYWELDALLGTKLRQDRLVGRTAGCPAAVWHPGNGGPGHPRAGA